MGNSGSITISSGADINADVYMATIQVLEEGSSDTDEFAEETRISERVVLQAGIEPSYGVFSIALAGGIGDESAFSVAFKAIAKGIKLRTRCTISHVYGSKSTPILTGTIT